MFIRVLNSEFEVLYVHTTSAGNNFNAVTNNIKKVEEVRRDGQAKALAKRAKTSSNFQGFYSRGLERQKLAAKQIQSTEPTSTCNYSGNRSHKF